MRLQFSLLILVLLTMPVHAAPVAGAEASTGSMVTDPATGMQFMFAKGGCYRMGDTFGDGKEDEKPAHEVCVDSFYIGKYTVTEEQWQKMMGSNPSSYKQCGRNCPVQGVSWNDIQKFIRTVNQLSGKNYRLPTEAEWEYAARSGGKSEKWAGTSSESGLGKYAWYNLNSHNQIHPVGQKQPNGLGIYDMSGNVWEWCQDWYGAYYYKESPKNNPQGPANGSARVVRGGSWVNLAWGLRASYRYRDLPESRTDMVLGFRLARTP
jgi:sulfatase modifying factor 1